MSQGNKLIKKIFWVYSLECLTGLHIGGSSDGTEIGGVDNPVIRRRDNQQPYIPGSSLKGKMRCLLQQFHGEWTMQNQANNKVAQLFGCTDHKTDKNLQGHASRLIVRDAYLTDEWEEKLRESPHTDMPYTEQKYENTIDRITGTTVRGGIRNQERIPAGAKFKLQFVLNIFEDNDEKSLLKTFYQGIKLLENDYLGGSGSRGYGHINLTCLEHYEKDAAYFEALSIPKNWATKTNTDGVKTN